VGVSAETLKDGFSLQVLQLPTLPKNLTVMPLELTMKIEMMILHNPSIPNNN
jgi:hypothetical protein